MVPIFLLVFHYDPQHTVGTSLAVVFANAAAGTISYMRQKRIDYRTGIQFAAATVPGALIGAYLARYFTSTVFSVVFGVVLISISLFTFFKPVPKKVVADADDPEPALPRWHVTRRFVDAYGHEHVYAFNRRNGVGLSFVIGFMSSILGIGGGIIHVPAMVFLFSFPPHIATATSHFILAISALTGTASHLYYGNVLLWTAIPMAAGAIAGAQVGAALSRRIHSQLLVRLLAVALMLVGLRLISAVVF